MKEQIRNYAYSALALLVGGVVAHAGYTSGHPELLPVGFLLTILLAACFGMKEGLKSWNTQ